MGATSILTGKVQPSATAEGQCGDLREAARLLALSRYDLAETAPEAALGRIASMAATRLAAPYAAIVFVDADRIWCKATHGLPQLAVAREPGCCARALLSDEPSIIADAAHDVRARAIPLFATVPGLNFYASAPLRTADGFTLGVLCVLDHVARRLPAVQVQALQDLAALVMDVLELRLTARHEAADTGATGREADHRVMNSLQFISAMLTLQARSADSDEVKDQLDAASRRVAAVARIHRTFYLEPGAPSAGCLEYLQVLCVDLASILQAKVEVDGEEALVPSKYMQPIGLLVNELVTNAAKHGDGPIQVWFGPAGDGELALRITDAGPGLPAGFDKQSGGLGLRLVGALTRQLRGRLETGSGIDGAGASFTVRFPGVLS